MSAPKCLILCFQYLHHTTYVCTFLWQGARLPTSEAEALPEEKRWQQVPPRAALSGAKLDLARPTLWLSPKSEGAAVNPLGLTAFSTPISPRTTGRFVPFLPSLSAPVIILLQPK